MSTLERLGVDIEAVNDLMLNGMYALTDVEIPVSEPEVAADYQQPVVEEGN